MTEQPTISIPQKFEVQRGEFTVSITREPGTVFSSAEQLALSVEVMEVVRRTSGRRDMEDREVFPYLMGVPGRGKILAVVRDGQARVKGFAAGQILNDGQKALLFEGEQVLHVSTAHVLPGQKANIGIMALQELYMCCDPRPFFVSAFTQSPRVYEYVKRFSKGNIYPSEGLANDRLEKIYRELVMVLGAGAKNEIENGVFKGKMGRSFYENVQVAGRKETNNWFFGTLGVDPTEGDLLLILLSVVEGEGDS